MTDHPDQSSLPLREAARLFGTTVDALRLRVRRGTLTGVDLADSRGQRVVGVLLSELRQAFPGTNQGATTPTTPTVDGGNHPTTQATSHGATTLAAELERERTIRQAQAEASSRALAVIQDRQLAPVLDQLRQDVRSARRDARVFSVVAVLAVGGIAWFAVNQVQKATSSTVLAQERTIHALEQVGDAQAKALQEATNRAALEAELATSKAQAKEAIDLAKAALDAESRARRQAEARLVAIGLAQRARTAVGAVLQGFR